MGGRAPNQTVIEKRSSIRQRAERSGRRQSAPFGAGEIYSLWFRVTLQVNLGEVLEHKEEGYVEKQSADSLLLCCRAYIGCVNLDGKRLHNRMNGYHSPQPALTPHYDSL